MRNRGTLGIAAVALLACTGASYRTQNFIVDAPTAEAAERFGRTAEFFRKQKAIEWLGREMPPWPQPCPLQVKITMSGAGGATSFQFTGDHVSQTMQIEGSYERLLNSVLPHEVTHTVFAHHFRRPVPRWADEGGSVLSEDDQERHRHDTLCRQILNAGRAMRLRVLFSLKEYPSDVMVLYAEGFSVCRFLVELGDRQRFLGFVGHGMTQGWDAAAKAYYNFRSVEELEAAWIQSLRRPRSDGQLAQGKPTANTPGELTHRQVVVRQTAPPGVPILGLPEPVVRAQSPEEPTRAAAAPMNWTPDPTTARNPPPPPPPPINVPPPVRLGLPEYSPQVGP